jgi:hypothetical protein
MKTFARKCSVTGELFNYGYVWFGGEFYTKDEDTTANEIRKRLKEDSMLDLLSVVSEHLLTIEDDRTLIGLIFELSDSEIYYTMWDEEDHQYAIDEQGNEIELTN